MVKLLKDYSRTESTSNLCVIHTRMFTVIISPYIHSDVLVATIQSGSPWDREQPPHEYRIFRYSEVMEPNIAEPAVFGQPLRRFRVEPVQVSEIWRAEHDVMMASDVNNHNKRDSFFRFKLLYVKTYLCINML